MKILTYLTRPFIKLLIIMQLIAILSGCAMVFSPTLGLYTNVKGPVATGTTTRVDSVGKACAYNVLGFIAVGDASIHAAKKDGDIQHIASVNFSSLNILYLYGRYCTLVRGY